MGAFEECEVLVDDLRNDEEFLSLVGRLHETSGDALSGDRESAAEFAAALVAVWDRLEQER
jgi:hypothetical protein